MFSQNQAPAQEVLSEEEQKEVGSSTRDKRGTTIHQGDISFSGNVNVTTQGKTPVPVNINVGHTNTNNTIFTRSAIDAQEQYRCKQEQDAREKKAKELAAIFLRLQTSLPAQYERYYQLERLFDGGKTSIADSFINLALIKETEHKQKEKGLDCANLREFIDERMASHEELYAVKEPLALNQLFEPKDDTKTPEKILILGRAGVGKSVLCQYLAVQWASECKDAEQNQDDIGNYLRQKFDAVFLVKLREIADFLSHPDIDKPTARKNLLGYVIHKFCFMLNEDQSPEEIESYIQSNKNKVLFILDGYDEITERVAQSRYLNDFLDRMTNQPYLLMTSRPLAMDTLKIKFNRKLENIGFTNENIQAYVRHFMRDAEKPNQAEPLLKFLKTHPSIWGIAHIPINLELLSWLWSKEKLVLKQGQSMTLSKLYQIIVSRVQEEYAKKQESKEEELSSSELSNEFLECLAYKAMQQESLLIPEDHIRKVLSDTLEKHHQKNNPKNQERVLKSATDQFGFLRATGQGGRSQLDQTHYFIHLSFQEFYAARYITRILSSPIENEEKTSVIQSIIREKYLPRYQLMLWMTAGLLYQQGVENRREFLALEQFWQAILSKPRDLIGYHHGILVMHCLDECEVDPRLPLYKTLIDQQLQWFNFYMKRFNEKYIEELARCPLFHSSQLVVDHLLKNLKDQERDMRSAAVSALGNLQNPSDEVVAALFSALKDENEWVRSVAVSALSKLQNPRDEVVAALFSALKDENEWVRRAAVSALGNLQNPSDEVVAALLSSLKDKNEYVRSAAVDTLGKLQNPSDEVVAALLSGLKDEKWRVRYSAISALGNLQNLSSEVVAALFSALKDEERVVKSSAISALSKLQNPSDEVVAALLSVLKDKDEYVRSVAVSALGKLQNSSDEVVAALLSSLKDEHEWVRRAAVSALGDLQNPNGEVVTALLNALKDNQWEVTPPKTEVGNLFFSLENNKDKDMRRATVDSFITFSQLRNSRTDYLRIIFEKFMYHPSLQDYLSQYFEKNYLLCIDHENKQVILSLHNKIHTLSLQLEDLVHLEQQIKAIAKQEGYPLDILDPVVAQRRSSSPTLFGKSDHSAERTPKQEVQKPEQNYRSAIS